MPSVDKEKDGHTDTFWVKVDAVANLILENQNYLNKNRNPELVEIVKNKWGVEKRQAEDYIKFAKIEVRKLGLKNTKRAFVRAMRDREWIIHEAKKIDDKKEGLKIVLAAIKDREEIHGLYTTQVEHSGTVSLRGLDLSRLIDEDLAVLEGLVRQGEDVKPFLLSKGIKVD